MATERARPWVVFTERALFERRAAEDALIVALAGVTQADIVAFRATGEYDDPASLARACNVWVRARRPKPIPEGGWRRVVNELGDDPGDLTSRLEKLWRQKYFATQPARVAPARLQKLGEGASVGFLALGAKEQAEALAARAGAPFSAVLAAGDALGALASRGHLIGAGDTDKALAEASGWLYHPAGADPNGLVDRLVERLVR